MYAVQFWSLVTLRIFAKSGVHLGVKGMISSLHNPYDEKLSSINMFSIVKSGRRGKLIVCFLIFNGFTKLIKSKLVFCIDDTI